MKHVLYFLFLFIGITSCTSSVSQKHDELMALHDESMLKMPIISKYLTDTKNASETALLDLNAQLQHADDEMWAWMHQYSEPDKKSSSKDQLSYYTDQYQKMIKVNKDMDNSIALAIKLLEDE